MTAALASPFSPPVTQRPPLSNFEGCAVSGTTLKIAGSAVVDGVEGDFVVGMDDVVRLVGEFRVVGVRFYVDKNGDTQREQLLKPQGVTVCPWDANDPTDDGVSRRRPRVSP